MQYNNAADEYNNLYTIYHHQQIESKQMEEAITHLQFK